MRAILMNDLMESRLLCWAILGVIALASVLPTDLGHTWRFIALFFLLPMFACTLGGRILAQDLSEDRLPHLLVLPISRSKLFGARVVSGVIQVLVIAAVAVPLVLASISPHQCLLDHAPAIFVCAAGLVLMYALGAFYSLICERSHTACFLSFLTAIVGFSHFEVLRHCFVGYHRSQLFGCHYPLAIFLVFVALSILIATLAAVSSADLLDRKDRIKYAIRYGFYTVLASLTLFLCLA